MKKFLLIFILFSSACAGVDGPDHQTDNKHAPIVPVALATLEEVQKACDRNDVGGCALLGFPFEPRPFCTIYFVTNDWYIFVHEYKHCKYGRWHKELEP